MGIVIRSAFQEHRVGKPKENVLETHEAEGAEMRQEASAEIHAGRLKARFRQWEQVEWRGKTSRFLLGWQRRWTVAKQVFKFFLSGFQPGTLSTKASLVQFAK